MGMVIHLVLGSRIIETLGKSARIFLTGGPISRIWLKESL